MNLSAASRLERPATVSSSTRWARRIAIGGLAAWGLLHIVGGGVLAGTTYTDGASAALELLGTGARAGGVAADPGPVAQGVLGFHGFNLLVAGAAVVVLAALAARGGWPRGVTTSFGLILAADAGLILFLLAPGYMSLADGIWGPLLLVPALMGAWKAGWRPRQL